MDALLTSQATLLLAMGMTAYLGLLHLGYTRHGRDPHLWLGVWSIAVIGSQAGRLVQLSTHDPLVAVLAARCYAAIAPLLIASLCGFARALSGRRTPRVWLAGFALANLTFSAAIAGTRWFLPGETSPTVDWFGATYIGVKGRPLMLLLPAYMAWACAWVIREVYRSAELWPIERGVLLASLGLYAAMGLSSVASSVGWISSPGAAEYGPMVLGVGVSFLLVHRRRRLEDSLQSLVDARTTELAASETRYRGLIENAPIGIFACDPLGRITTRNPRLLEILGKPASAGGRPEDDVLTHPLGIAAGVAETVRECLSRGEVIGAEHRYTSSWGRTADIRLIVAPIRGTSGAITGALGLVEDISDRRTLEEGLRRSQKLESVGQLAAGIAHEINNPMAFVRTNLAVLREEWNALEKEVAENGAPALAARFAECEALIDESLEGVERTIAIARDMREFAHSGSCDRSAVELNQLVESCVRFASPHCKGATRIEEDYGDVGAVWANAGQLRQVFVNLLVNALQSVGHVGTVRVATALEGHRAVVRVSDDGAGVAPEHLDRLFDPFFTTKPSGEGTGLGLYVSHEIVRGHGGEITVASRPGEGATFAVHLPRARPEGA